MPNYIPSWGRYDSANPCVPVSVCFHHAQPIGIDAVLLQVSKNASIRDTLSSLDYP